MMSWLESILFGLVCGLTEFLPVSAQAHETLLLKVFGASATPLLRLVIHGTALVALYQSCAMYIGQIFQEQQLIKIPPRRRKRQPDMVKVLDYRLLRTATVIMSLGFIGYTFLSQWQGDLYFIAPMLAINGLILYIPMHLATGNKDSRTMSQLDAVLLGLMGAAAVIPGISAIGLIIAAGIIRGADREHALNWALLLGIPSLVIRVGFDVYSIMTDGLGSLSILSIGLAAAAAFGGAYCAIRVMRFLAVKAGFSCFGYYCWGAALFALLIFLTV